MIQLFSFGSNGNFQLGLNHDDDIYIPQQVQLPTNHSIVDISAGGNHTLLLTKDGKVFGVGDNSSFQLGSISSENHIKILENWIPIHCQDESLVFQSIACGWSHSILIDSNGVAYGMGSNQFGQLGLGDLKSIHQLTPIACPKAIVFVKAACGLRHTLLLTRSGDCYATGSNKFGQLGLPTLKNISQLQKIEHFPSNVIDIRCGERHTVLLTESGEVFTFGNNRFFQLGYSTEGINCHSITQVPLNQTIKSISCGWQHSVALSAEGQLLGWGGNDHHQLGASDTCDGIVPILTNIILTSAGSAHTIAVSNTGEILVWGWNEHGNCQLNNLEFNHVDLNTAKSNPINLKGQVHLIYGGCATSWILTDWMKHYKI